MNGIEILEDMFGGKVLDDLLTTHKCVKCKVKKNSWKELDPHHVTYTPHLVKYLCKTCHARITYMNGVAAKKVHGKLTNEQRLIVWNKFLTEPITEEYELSLLWFNNFCVRVKL